MLKIFILKKFFIGRFTVTKCLFYIFWWRFLLNKEIVSLEFKTLEIMQEALLIDKLLSNIPFFSFWEYFGNSR